MQYKYIDKGPIQHESVDKTVGTEASIEKHLSVFIRFASTWATLYIALFTLHVHSAAQRVPVGLDKVLVIQLCLTLCDPVEYSLLGSSVHRIFQARILQWVTIPFSRESSQPRDRTRVSCIAGRFFSIWDTRDNIPPNSCLSGTQSRTLFSNRVLADVIR